MELAARQVTAENKDNRKKILVVDDYLPTRDLIVESLSQSGQYKIAEAADGEEALRIFYAGHYDLVISDIIMPGMGGMELLHAIREIDSSTVVIMITAHPAVELTVSAMKQGAVDFLKKPFDIDDLIFKVNLYLREDAPLPEGAIPGKENYLNIKSEKLSLQSYIYESVEKTDGDKEEVFQKIVELALRIVGGECCALFLYDEGGDEFYPKVVRNNGSGFSWQSVPPAMKSIFSEVAAKKDGMMFHSENDPLIAPSLICAPLMIRDSVLGVICIRKRKNGGVFTKNDLHHVLSLSKRASLNIENKVLYESIYSNLMDTFKSLVASVQVRDHYTEEHSIRVSELAVKIAEGFQCSENEVTSIRIAALLHDIGKISIPDSILLKVGNLTAEEYQTIKNHPCIGEDILSPVILLDKERNIIRHHHERWDGRGYPNGLAGERIPLLARILAVADSFDAMTNDRPYHKGMSLNCAAVELKKNKNIQFDSKIVDVFLNIL